MAARTTKSASPDNGTGFQSFGDSPEAIALTLLIKMAELDGVNLSATEIPGKERANGRWLLKRYESILKVIKA